MKYSILKLLLAVPYIFLMRENSFAQNEDIDTASIPHPYNIDAAALQFHPLTLPLPLNPNEALKKLFPGNFFWSDDGGLSLTKDLDSGRLFSLWRCGGCKQQLLNTWMKEEIDTFPYFNCNYTHIPETKIWQDQSGRTHTAIVFSTSDDPEPFGRFKAPVVGIALFGDSSGFSLLRNFSPAIVAAGSYNEIRWWDTIHLTDKVTGFLFSNMNGGPGGPYSGDYLLLLPIRNSVETVLEVLLSDYFSVDSIYWQTKMIVGTGVQDFPDLKAITFGSYRKVALPDGEVGFFGEHEDLFSESHNDKFSWTRTYHFNGTRYELLSEKFEILH